MTALVLAVGACGDGSGGGSEDGSDAGSNGGDEQATGDCGDELTLGILVPLTGELGDFGAIWQQASELAVSQVNESGMLPDGWEMTVAVADEQSDPEEGLRAARNLINSDEVSGIVGPTSGPAVAIVGTAADTQTPVISGGAGTINLNELGGDWVYRTVPSDLGDGAAVARFLLETGVDNLGVMVQNEESTVSTAAAMVAAYTEGGGEVAADVNYNPAQTSYQAELQGVVDAQPDTLFLAGGQESGVTIIREARSLGFDGDIVVTADLIVDEVVEALGEDAEGVFGGQGDTDDSLGSYQDFAAAYEEAYDSEPGPYTANAYDAAMLIALGALAAESTCGADINASLRDVADPPGTEVTSFEEAAEVLAEGEEIDYFGASGPVDFDESGTVTGAYSIYEVQDGAWEPVEFYDAESFQSEE